MLKLLFQPETDPPYGFNILFIRHCLQLFSDVADMHVDCLVLPDINIIPRVIIDILLGENLIRMQEQKLQDLELLSCQLHRLSAH